MRQSIIKDFFAIVIKYFPKVYIWRGTLQLVLMQSSWFQILVLPFMSYDLGQATSLCYCFLVYKMGLGISHPHGVLVR